MVIVRTGRSHLTGKKGLFESLAILYGTSRNRTTAVEADIKRKLNEVMLFSFKRDCSTLFRLTSGSSWSSNLLALE